MQQLTDAQMRALGTASDRFVPERHPIRDMWLGVIDAILRLVTLGNGRVVSRIPCCTPAKWDGIIR